MTPADRPASDSLDSVDELACQVGAALAPADLAGPVRRPDRSSE